jgi:hypothetical protein
MTTATEKKANATEQQAALSKLPIPHVNPKQVEKAAKTLEKVANKGQAVSTDQPKSVKVVNSSVSGTNGTRAKPKVETVAQAVDRMKGAEGADSFNDTWVPGGGIAIKYYTKEELAQIKTPWVMVKGVLLEPKQVGIKGAGRITTESGHTFWLNSFMSPRRKDVETVFSHYIVECDGVTVHMLLDEKSSAQVNSFDAHRGGMGGQEVSRHMVNQAILINTDSTHDTYLGEVHLENQSTHSCVFNQATVNSNPRYEDRYKAPWLVQQSRDNPRRELRYSTLTRSSVFNSTITDTIQLLDTTLDEANIKTNEGFVAVSSSVKECTIKGIRAKLKFARLEKTYIPSNGHVLIVNTNMKDESLGDKPVYIPNKFCTLKVDLPHDHLSMRRENATKVGITIGYRTAVDLDIDAPMDVIDAKVREVLRDSSYHNPLDPDMKDPVVANLIHYVVQNIRSRLRVIKMLDSVVRTSRVVTGEVYREDEEMHGFYPQRF